MGRAPAKAASKHFKIMKQLDVPQGRNGKHKGIVTVILSDLDQLTDGSAIKVPLSELAESKAKVRSANRASRKAGRKVVTASDDSFLYVWNAKL
jgi:hypothetical protein